WENSDLLAKSNRAVTNSTRDFSFALKFSNSRRADGCAVYRRDAQESDESIPAGILAVFTLGLYSRMAHRRVRRGPRKILIAIVITWETAHIRRSRPKRRTHLSHRNSLGALSTRPVGRFPVWRPRGLIRCMSEASQLTCWC